MAKVLVLKKKRKGRRGEVLWGRLKDFALGLFRMYGLGIKSHRRNESLSGM